MQLDHLAQLGGKGGMLFAALDAFDGTATGQSTAQYRQ
jgi:hypothetical protein